TNTNGLIEALANSEVQLTTNVSITGGILSTTGNGVIRELDGQNVFLTDLTNAGAILVNNNASLHTSGTITNSGSITLNSSGNNTDLHLSANTILTGSGTVTLAANNNNRITADSLLSLTNVNNLIQGFGQIGVNAITIDNQGTIDANVMSQTLTIDPANVANAFVNEANGLVRASNGGILLLSGSGSGSFDNRGTLAATTGGALQFTGTVTSSGTVDVGNNSLSISGNGNFTQTAGTFRLAGGTFTSSNGLSFNGGLIDARGTINSAITNSALLRPALGGSGLNVTGSVSLLSASQLSFQLGGLTQGSQYGFLNVNGTVALGGQLVLSFANGFQNSVTGSDTFTLMTTNGLNGSFTNIASGDRLQTSDGFGSFLVTYNGTTLSLSNFILGSGPTVVTATWLHPADGNWTTATNWSSNPNFPNNGTPSNTLYDAVIDATGAPYTVTLANAVT
ncbi:MAG: beta strand repeat-containing protein, partial [Bryobacteraceae bacterium]